MKIFLITFELLIMKQKKIMGTILINTRLFLFICRHFLFNLTSPKAVETNPRCIVKTEVICDRSEPILTFELIPEVQGIQMDERHFIYMQYMIQPIYTMFF